MIKIRSTSICRSLRLIFNHCIDNTIYPCKSKKANAVSILKKGDKQTLKNCCPVSIFAICNKIFERLLHNKICGFVLDIGLISADQSEFFFFNYYLAAPGPAFGHFHGDNLTKPMLITAFFMYFVHGEPRNQV